MRVEQTPLEGLLVLHPEVYNDPRGYFFESFNQRKFDEAVGAPVQFVQDNRSFSVKNVVRGLHFQKPPHAQSKLVSVIRGAVLDVSVDIRKDSPTYGQTYSIELNEHNKTMLYIPAGFAHGFATLEDDTMFFYKCSDFYNKESEDGIMWNDPNLNIDWQVSDPIQSDKDQELSQFNSFSSPF